MQNYQVPEDFSLLSYNDSVLASMTQPQLSSIRIHMKEMAQMAVEIIEKNMDERETFHTAYLYHRLWSSVTRKENIDEKGFVKIYKKQMKSREQTAWFVPCFFYFSQK